MDFGDGECWRLRGQEGCREKEQRMKGSEAEQEERGLLCCRWCDCKQPQCAIQEGFQFLKKL